MTVMISTFSGWFGGISVALVAACAVVALWPRRRP